MTKLAAIKYLLENGSHHSEWAEAGLLHAVETIVYRSFTTPITKAMLDGLLKQASNY